MKSKFLAVPLFALCAGSAFAVDPITQNFEVRAVVPAVEFKVEPKGDWLTKGITLAYNDSNKDFSEVTENFTAISSVGPIDAKLTDQAVLNDDKGNAIDLEIKVGGQVLTSTAVEVVNQSDAETERDLPIVVKATKPDDGYVGGDYNGTVSIMFETSAPS